MIRVLDRDIPVPDAPSGDSIMAAPSGDSIMAQPWFWPLMGAVAITAGIAIVLQVLGIRPKVLLAFTLAVAATAFITLVVARS